MSIDTGAYRIPAQGPFVAQPVGCILHGSRSGVAGRSMAEEVRGTINWAVTNGQQMGWHVTIGSDLYVPHLAASQWGWHAREHSMTYLGAEFAQPTVDDAITDGQVRAFVAWWRREVLPVWPKLALERTPLPAHSEMPAGKRDGKTDTYPVGDARNDDLRRRIRAAWQASIDREIDSVDAALEAAYQKDAARLGKKRFAGRLDRDYYRGPVLVCQRGIVTSDGTDIMGNAIDDFLTLNDQAGTLTRY